jgi:D-alanine--poly(phosphoribitol) ligase subunit 2
LDVPSVDADLFDAGTLDSLAFVNLLVYIEEEFGVKVPLDDLELDHFRSISKVSELIDTRLVSLRQSSMTAEDSQLAAAGGGAV